MIGDRYFQLYRRGESAREAIFTRKVGHTQRGGRPILFDRFYAAQLGRFKKGELKAEDLLGSEKSDAPNEQAAWAALARVLLNLDETIMKS